MDSTEFRSETMPLSNANVSMPGELANTVKKDEKIHPRVNIQLEDCIISAKAGPLGINHDITARWGLQCNHVAHLIETENTLIYRDGIFEDFAEARLKDCLDLIQAISEKGDRWQGTLLDV